MTGGVTTFAKGDRTPSTILDGLNIDENTLSKEGGKLSVIGGVGGASNWDELEGKPSWIGDTKPSYVWSEIGGKPTTLGGTKTEAGNTFVNVSGDIMTGVLTLSAGLHLPYGQKIDSSYGYILTTGYDNVNGYNDYFIIRASGANGLEKLLKGGNSGKLTWDNNTIWHAGNDGEGSGLNADLLDGFQITQLCRCYITNSHNVYDCLGTIQLPQGGCAARLYLVVGDGYNASESQSRVGMIILRTSNGNSNGIGKYYAGHVEAFRYGLYDIYVVQNSSTSFTLWTARTNYTGSGYISVEATPGVNFTSSSTTSTTLPTGATLLSKYQVAYTDSNVASATKLQTARTIWGQSFDGTGNVSGNMTDVGSISASNNSYYINNNETNPYLRLIAGGVTSYVQLLSDGKFVIGQSILTNNNIIIDTNGNVGIGTTSPAYKLDVNGDIHTNGWLRTTGNVGWYSQSHDGGWYMTDGAWVRSYNNKSVYTAGIMQAGGGFETTNSSILRFTTYTNKNVISWGWDTTWEDCITFNIPGTNNQSIYMKFSASKGLNLWGTFTANGNILATGGITCYSSDQRAKTVIEQISLSLKQIANAPTIRFKWNGWKIKDDGKTHIGGIAQYMQKLLPETVLEADGALNMDYATTGYIFAVQTAKHLVKTDTEIDKLKKRVKRLEKQLKQLGYEEANIMDDKDV